MDWASYQAKKQAGTVKIVLVDGRPFWVEKSLGGAPQFFEIDSATLSRQRDTCNAVLNKARDDKRACEVLIEDVATAREVVYG